jgi:FAD/FMN-containing dehydrogenase
VLPGQDGRWDQARRAWNLAVDQEPAAVVVPGSADDVVAAVDLALERGQRLAAQTTGHAAAPLVANGPFGDTIRLRTQRMRGVSVDPDARIVRVEAGAVWADAVAAAAGHGLAGLAGSASNVGVAGYTLGGGISSLGRRYGLACNNVEAVELVTADGRMVQADRDSEPDLFWALRGGGGSFGAVTAIELRLFPIAEVYAGSLWWPIELGDSLDLLLGELAAPGLCQPDGTLVATLQNLRERLAEMTEVGEAVCVDGLATRVQRPGGWAQPEGPV